MTETLSAPTRRARSYITLPGYRAGMEPANKGKRYPAEVLNPHEIANLLAACPRTTAGLRMRALIVLLYRTGLRISEALDLETKDIDLERGTITVLHGKGDRRRVVGIDVQAQAVVEQWLDRRRELGLPGRIVFCVFSRSCGGIPGARQHSSVIREALKDLALKAGVEKRVHPHGLRHTHAAEVAREGMPLHVIRKQLGHADLGTTARYIDHLSPEDVIRAIHERPEWAPNSDHVTT